MFNEKQLPRKRTYPAMAVCIVGLLWSLGIHDGRSAASLDKPSPQPSPVENKKPKTAASSDIDPQTGDYYMSGAQARLGEVRTDNQVDKDIFQPQVTAHPLKGTLAYVVAVFKVPPISYIVIRHFTDDPGPNNSTVKSYAIEGTGVNLAHNPVLSPSNRFVAFTVGFSDMYPYYHLYVLDLQTNILKLVSHEVFNYDEVLWSPDEQYLAFMEEWAPERKGPFVENPFGSNKDLRVIICQWRTGKTVPAIANRDAEGGFCWTAPHRLIYGVVPTYDEIYRGLKRSSVLYATDAATRTAHLIVTNAERPAVSPDGQSVAYFGAWNPTTETSAFYVARRGRSKRKVLSAHLQRLPEATWLHDNRHLLTIERPLNSSDFKAIVKKWDSITGTQQSVGTFIAREIPNAALLLSNFTIGNVSADDTTLLCNVAESLAQPAAPTSGDKKQRVTLQAMNLKTGKVEIICTGYTVYTSQPDANGRGDIRSIDKFEWQGAAGS